jgi:hypothetical protein
VQPERTFWDRFALLRPGHKVVLINLSAGGALVESYDRMQPGARAELQLTGPKRIAVRGRVDRCRVMALKPLRYQGAIVFDQRFDWTGSTE